MLSLGELIKTIRTEDGVSLRELAKKSKSSPSYLSLIEQDKRVPKPDVLKRISEALRDDETEVVRLYELLMKRAGYIEPWEHLLSPTKAQTFENKLITDLTQKVSEFESRISELQKYLDLNSIANGSSTATLDGVQLSKLELQSIKMIIDGIRANRKEK